MPITKRIGVLRIFDMAGRYGLALPRLTPLAHYGAIWERVRLRAATVASQVMISPAGLSSVPPLTNEAQDHPAS